MQSNVKTTKMVSQPTAMPLWINLETTYRKRCNGHDAHLFEETELDMANDPVAGPFGCLSLRPLSWKVDSVEYVNDRAISITNRVFVRWPKPFFSSNPNGGILCLASTILTDLLHSHLLWNYRTPETFA
jgi:hypothetical protein